MTRMRHTSSAPESLVRDGRVSFGVFDGPIRDVNMLDARRPFGLSLPRRVRAFRLKEWQAFQLSNERYFILLALFDAKSLALAQAKVYDRETGKKHIFERKLPPWRLHVAKGLGRTQTRYREDSPYKRPLARKKVYISPLLGARRACSRPSVGRSGARGC